MIFNKMTLSLIAIITLSTVQISKAQERAPRIAIVNVERVTELSATMSESVAELKRNVKNKRNQIEGLILQHRKMKADFKRQESLMSEEKAKAKAEEIRDMEISIRKLEFETQKTMKVFEKDLDASFAKIAKIAEQLATEEGFDIVLSKDLVLYSNKKFDLTEEVSVLLEDQLQKEKAEAEAEAEKKDSKTDKNTETKKEKDDK